MMKLKRSLKRKHMFGKILVLVLILLLLSTSILFGLGAQKQKSLLTENRKKLSETESSLTALNNDFDTLTKENELLKTDLASCSGYLSEEDLTSPGAIHADASGADAKADEDDENEKDETEDEDDEKTGAASAYQKKYKNLYVRKQEQQSGKIVHLTFDDGPSQNTPKVLDILDQYNIKATFFVVYTAEEPYCNYYQEIVERGHTLAIHTASHNYKQIYASVDAYLEDFNKIYTYVYEKTGVRPTLFRYPGGSTNCLSYASGKAIMKEMDRRGFIYYDWNVSSGDGGNQATRSTIYEWVTTKALTTNESVVLMHDSGGKGETVAALPSVIETLQDAGCTFAPLTSSTKPVQFVSADSKKD